LLVSVVGHKGLWLEFLQRRDNFQKEVLFKK
jgi:hypothetical protein